jgi:peptidoglycan/LPS O-acetylase OafA/YrhL
MASRRITRRSHDLPQGHRGKTATQGRSGYIPTLDGWRAIAIITVLLAHIPPLPLPGRVGHKVAVLLWTNGGTRGVDIFFAISGLLICSRLLDEEVRVGHISLKNFYVRRAFRILPPAVLFLLVLALLHVFGPIQLSRVDWLASLLFFRNYTVDLSRPTLSWWFTSHFWSLSVEEQFYLLFPALLVFLPRWRLRSLFAIAFLSVAWKLYVVDFLHLDAAETYVSVHYHTAGCIDALLIAAGIAVYTHRANGNKLLDRWLSANLRLAFLVPIAAWLFLYFSPWPMAKIAGPLLILVTVHNSKSVAGKFLESVPLRWIGRLSYSLYVWQELFLCTRFSVKPPLGRVQQFPYNLMCLVACACLSYFLVERPMIRIGHWLTRSPSLPIKLDANPVILSPSI